MEPVLTILVTLDAEGQVGIKTEGPSSNNKVVMLGLLEVAKAAITAAPPPEPQSLSPIVPGGMVPRFNRYRR